MTTAHETLHEVNDLGRQLKAAIPEVYAGYVQMSSAAMGEGAASLRRVPGVRRRQCWLVPGMTRVTRAFQAAGSSVTVGHRRGQC